MSGFNNLTESFKRGGIQKDASYPGVVVDNEGDPEKRGRCRVRIPQLNDDVPVDMLPWYKNLLQSHTQGASTVSGGFSVPRIGSKVNIVFLEGDVYSGSMVSYDTPGDTVLAERLEDYPHTHILYRFDTNTKAIYNVLKRVFRWFNNRDVEIKNDRDIDLENGRDLTVKNERRITIKNGENVIIENQGNITLKNGGNVDMQNTGTVTIVSGGSITVTAPETTLNTTLNLNGDFNHNGDLNQSGNQSVSGNISATGSILNGGANSNHHKH